ncbi:hypothetical protein SAMN06269185_3036 [Natronoarchaeum philippinense]|uniref:BNR/Asp-box repeat-containing protein n=1 Tax=Natronoarchaeum philippinense TaxID=558529 RepID=A0A285P887_NATPI|nr:hypothetical protein [Natronoarchaeum philippinense]SNZ17477.1 hypothetical protein SAMN06269185_3036 [Natronoarchaeum philippinense]
MTVYAAMRNGVLTVRESGGEWLATEGLADKRVECVAATDTQAFCGTFESGLYRTVDGESWERIGAGSLPEAVTAVRVSPHDPREIWVGTEPSRLFRSPDAGKTWGELPALTDLPSADEWSFPPRPATHHVRWIELDPTDPERVYVGIEAGALLVSEDGGETWTDRPEGSRRDNHWLATHPEAPGRVYSAAGDGYAESTDGGMTWGHPQNGLEHHYVWSVAADPGDPDTVLVSAASGANSAHRVGESYVYRRRGEGAWSRIGDEYEAGAGLPTGQGTYRYVLSSGDEPSELWALSNTGLFRTEDAGESWNRVSIDWPDRFDEQTARGLAVVE